MNLVRDYSVLADDSRGSRSTFKLPNENLYSRASEWRFVIPVMWEAKAGGLEVQG